MDTAVVKLNVADVREEPSHQASRVNQANWGERLDVVRQQDGWAEVVQDDGYRGWIAESYLAPITAGQVTEDGYNGVVTVARAPISVARTQPSETPYFLYYGTRVRVISKRAERWTVDRGDGARFVVNKRNIRPISSIKRPTGGAIAREARRFLGVPYLWGGITPAGFDCSGLVRAIFRVLGIFDFPRDTIDQRKIGEPVAPERISSGDLLYFPGHVAIAGQSGRIVHASRGAGSVREQSIVAGMPEYRKDLDETFEIARRVV